MKAGGMKDRVYDSHFGAIVYPENTGTATNFLKQLPFLTKVSEVSLASLKFLYRNCPYAPPRVLFSTLHSTFNFKLIH